MFETGETMLQGLKRLGFKGFTQRPGGYVKARHKNGRVAYIEGHLEDIFVGDRVGVACRAAERTNETAQQYIRQQLLDIDHQLRVVCKHPTRTGCGDARALLVRRQHAATLLEKNGGIAWDFTLNINQIFMEETE